MSWSGATLPEPSLTMRDLEDIQQLIIRKDLSIRDAMQRLDSTGLQILLIVEAGGRLCGVITDGDIRRYLLGNGNSMSAPVVQAMNSSFFSVPDGHLTQAYHPGGRLRYSQVPVVGPGGLLRGLLSAVDQESPPITKQSSPVVIMAGGSGTRLSPLTKIIPKPLMPVGEQTIVERIIDGFISCGYERFVLIVNYHKELIKSYLAESEYSEMVQYIDEPSKMGTAGGLSLLREIIREPFILSNCDVIAKADYADLMKKHLESAAELTILGVRKHVEIPYGVLEFDGQNQITAIKEKPSYNFTIMSGIYVVSPSVLDIIPGDRPYGMDELVQDCLREARPIACHEIEGGWFDMGQFDEYRTLLKHFGVIDAPS